jgi:Meiotically up-regulated gene 113
MDKQHIIDEIRRTAKDGRAIGQGLFAKQTGIHVHDWRGKFWARWSDALVEVGYAPNEWNAAHGESFIVESLVKLTRKLEKYPTLSEMGLERRVDGNFPSQSSIQTLCGKAELMSKLLEYCRTHEGFEDVERILRATPVPLEPKQQSEVANGQLQLGYVYLLLSARKYKIGYSKAALSRASVVSNLSPEGGEIIHLIRTDDMRGIEAYWHNRFADKRGNGEWFALSAADVKAFKRRKFM